MANLIKQLKEEQGLTNREIGELINKHESSVSEYLHEVRPIPVKVQNIISEILGIQKPKVYECELEQVTLTEASQRTGLSEYLIKCALKAEKYDFGTAIPGQGKKHKYVIFRGKFEKFIAENKAIQNG